MRSYAAKPRCKIPKSWIIEFDSDPDIDSIGLITSFYAASFLTVIVLTATYITSDPSTYTNFGFCKLDEVFIGSLQRLGREIAIKIPLEVSTRTKESLYESLKKAILVLSDHQLLAGIAMAVIGLVKHDEITKYHFNIVINLILVTVIAHSMTLGFTEEHIFQRSFSRIGRALAILLFGALFRSIGVVIGSNDCLWVYGLPAKCEFDDYAYGPLATSSLGWLQWFIIRECAYSFTILIPASQALKRFRAVLGSAFWLEQISDYLAKTSMYYDLKLAKCWHSMSTEPLVPVRYPQFIKEIHQLSYGALSIASISTKLLHALVYGYAQVWSSYGFSLCWTCYIFASTAKLIASQRKIATEKGMRGNEDRWGYVQPLSIILLVLLVIVVIKPFFDNLILGDSGDTSLESSGCVQDQISIPPREQDYTVIKSRVSLEQGPLSRQPIAKLKNENLALCRRKMEVELWDSWDFILYLACVHTAFSSVVLNGWYWNTNKA